jgi:hypothetical protein
MCNSCFGHACVAGMLQGTRKFCLCRFAELLFVMLANIDVVAISAMTTNNLIAAVCQGM